MASNFPDLEKKLITANKQLSNLQAIKQMLKEEVDDNDVADIVSRWTGVPVSRMMEGECRIRVSCCAF